MRGRTDSPLTLPVEGLPVSPKPRRAGAAQAITLASHHGSTCLASQRRRWTYPQNGAAPSTAFTVRPVRIAYIHTHCRRTAISTVLNNPHKKQAPPKAHSALPSAPPADLPRVRRKDFDSYLRAVAPEWDRYQHNAQLGREGSAQLDPSDDPPRALPPGRAIPPLAVVPRVFFDPAFALGDPRTFNAVTEQADDDADADPSALAHALPLLERLSHYADTIEQHLIQEISLRSTAFFAALANLHDLRAESAECLDRIAHLRALLAEVDEGGAKKGLAVIRRDARVRNVRRVREGVREVGAVVDVTGVARGLVGAGRWGDALDVIEEMEALWKAEPAPVPAPTTATPTRTRSPLPPTPESPPESPPSSLPESPRRPSIPSLSVPLSALHAFAHLPSHLTALTSEIAAALTAELVTLLHADLLARIQFHTSKAEGKGGEGEGSGEKEKEKEEALKDRLRPLLHGLARAGGVREAVGAWREAVLAEVRAAVTRVCVSPSLFLCSFSIGDLCFCLSARFG